MRQILSRGVLYSLGIVVNRIIPPGVMRFRIFAVYELSAREAETSKRAEGLRTTWCHQESQFEIAQTLTQYVPAPGENRANRSACLVLSGEDPVGALWLAVQSFDERDLGLRYSLADDQAWIFAAQICKPNRGRGVYRCLLDAVLSEPRDQRTFAAINPANRLSMAAHRSSIVRKLGTCMAICLFGSSFCLLSGALTSDGRLRRGSRDRPIKISWE